MAKEWRLEVSAEATVRGCCWVCGRGGGGGGWEGWGGLGLQLVLAEAEGMPQHSLLMVRVPHWTGKQDPGPLDALSVTESSGRGQ